MRLLKNLTEKKSSIFSFFLLAFSLSSCLFAAEGNTFKIDEDDPMQAMIQEMISMGEGRHPSQKNFQMDKEALLEQVKTLPAVEGLSETKEYRSYLFDPTYTVQEDIEDHKGRKIAKKGQKIDPLKDIGALQDLIFFDGTNPSHVKWAKTHPKAKWILVKGSPIEVEKQTKHPVYFDQMGEICRRFGLKKVPVKLSKKENKILIEEIPVEGRRR